MFGSNTLAWIAERAVSEVPPLTSEQERFLEEARDPVARALLELLPALRALPLPEDFDIEAWWPAIETTIKTQAMWCELTLHEDDPDIDEDRYAEAIAHREATIDFLDELNTAVARARDHW